ncbi:serine protease easter-like [Culex quinquefasciatus]|uniref:Serine protease easter n=2 Tax=Culex pipiens TaxID=7175 RepID=A0A8D8AUW8_CULPI|nr:serine protease easter-like [Culex quinquefasciatus]
MKTAVIHEFYDSSKKTNDIALVILKQAANIRSNFVRPICLPLATATLNSGNSKELRLTGSNFETRQTVSRAVAFLEKRKCKKNTSAQLDDRKLCVDLIDGSSIESGAVLHSLNKDNTGVIQYGIATFGGSGATGVFLKVSYYIDWILNHSE